MEIKNVDVFLYYIIKYCVRCLPDIHADTASDFFIYT